MTELDVLKQCRIEGNNVYLPDGQLDRKLYQKVAKQLTLIGGKWVGRKVQAFVFPDDPTELLTQIQGGEKRNLKKEHQFFGTPEELADTMVELADIEVGDRILEPSAGRGAIIKAIHRKYSLNTVYCYENMDINLTFLRKMTDQCTILGEDFLKACTESGQHYERIIANPPFSKNQDIDHVRHMYKMLMDGGKLVSIMSTHWTFASEKKCVLFRQWIEEVNAEVIEIPPETFKESGTNVASTLIIIDK